MHGNAHRVAGVTVEVEDLLRVRARLSGMTLASIRRRASYRSGARDTRSRGRGMEYEESRAYVAGDDVRTMDWRVMARTGEAHTKIFAEEKERRFVLALDLSPSMFFGTRQAFKSWAAAQVAAHVGWLASFAGDRVGGLVAAPGLHHEVRPGRASSGLLGIFHVLAAASRSETSAGSGHNRLNFLLHELHRVIKPGSIIALISDFIGLDDESSEILSALAGHNDINAFWIHDASEVDAWREGHYPVWLGQRRVDLDVDGEQAWLRKRQQLHRNQVESLCRRYSIPLLPVSCNRDITRQILAQLKL